jgi:hypothetical protein
MTGLNPRSDASAFHQALSGPMFDPKGSLLDNPAVLVVAAAALTLLVIGNLWLRRITEVEPDQTSFRALAERPYLPAVSLIVGVALLGFVAIFAGLSWMAIVGDRAEAEASTTIRGWFLIAGVVLEGLALALAARRLRVRSHL